MAAINALNTVVLSGGSLSEEVGYIIAAFFFVFAFFGFPRIIKILFDQFDKK